MSGPNLPVKSAKSELGYGDYLRFRDLVLQYSGLHFPEKKKADLETGLFKALAASPLASADGYSLDAYYNLLRDRSSPAGRAEMSRLINTLTIGETHFFRDEAQFNALANHVLPALIAHKRAAAAAIGSAIQPQLRIWSAGCATGEEPYSLAILLKELLPDLDNWHVLILATDINQDSLNRAREAVYSDWSFRENRARTLRPRYFTPGSAAGGEAETLLRNAGRYRLRDDVRYMVTFASLNLIDDSFPSLHNNTLSMDLILCRNVTIYFAEETTRRVVKGFYEALVEGGWLVVGHSEPSLAIYRAFQACSFADTLLYEKTGQPADWPVDWQWLDSAGAGPAAWPLDQAAKPGRSLAETPSNGAGPAGRSFTAGQEHGRIQPAILARQDQIDEPEPEPYEVAGELLNNGQIEQAIASLLHKLASMPDFAPAHALLGRAYANMGRWVEARQWCQSALKLNSLLAEPYYILALVDEHEHRLEAAIEMLKKAIYLERQAPLPHFQLAMLYKKTGQTRDARRSFQNTARVLEKWPPAAQVPDSGGATARQLLEVTRRLLKDLEG